MASPPYLRTRNRVYRATETDVSRIDRRWDVDVFQLDEVKALAMWRRASRNRAVRDRLKGGNGGAAPLAEVVNSADLQDR